MIRFSTIRRAAARGKVRALTIVSLPRVLAAAHRGHFVAAVLLAFAVSSACAPAAAQSSPAALAIADSSPSAPAPDSGSSPGPAAPAAVAADDSVLSLARARDVAFANNPGLAEIRARAEALAAVPSQVSTLPDPELSFSLVNLPTDSFNFNQEAMTQAPQFGIRQRLPFPGKLALLGLAAQHEADAALADVDELRLALLRDVQLVWWNLFYLDRALEIIERNQQLMRDFVDAAQEKYAVGRGLQQDVLLAQTELTRLLNAVIELQGVRRSEEARLAALLDWPGDQEITLPAELQRGFAAVADEPALLALADAERPLLRSKASRQAAAETRLLYARKDVLPDFAVGVNYGFRGGNNPNGSHRADFVSLMLSVNVPIFLDRKQRRAIDQRSAQLQESTFSLADSRAAVRREVTVALAQFRQSKGQYEVLHDGIIPLAEQTVAAMLAGYPVGKVDFLNLVSAQIKLYENEMQAWRAYSAAQQSLARLAAAVGKENLDD